MLVIVKGDSDKEEGFRHVFLAKDFKSASGPDYDGDTVITFQNDDTILTTSTPEEILGKVRDALNEERKIRDNPRPTRPL